MSTQRWVPALAIPAMLAVASGAFAQPCNPHPLRPDDLTPCREVLTNRLAPAPAVDAPTIRQVNAGMKDLRARVWKAFPDGADFDAAETGLLRALAVKDLVHLWVALPEGMRGSMATAMNLGGVFVGNMPEGVDAFPKIIDDGINPVAWPTFNVWVAALRRSEGRVTPGALATPFIFLKGQYDHSRWAQAYEDARNWAEFMNSGLDVTRYLTPKAYLIHQIENGVTLSLARSKPDDLPADPFDSARQLYDRFVEMFGTEEVRTAADAVLHLKKNALTGLDTPLPVSIGTFFAEGSLNPAMLFISRAANKSGRGYAITLCLDQYALLGGQAPSTFVSLQQWDKAFGVYHQLTDKYGAKAVDEAAARLQKTIKGPQGSIRGDPQVRSLVYWFNTLLTNPNADVPDGRLPTFHAASNTPAWLGHIIAVRGTVSRVDVAKGKVPPYATIHFTESSDTGIMGYSPESGMLQEVFGVDFSGLIGKPIEMWGEITQWHDGSGIRVLDKSQVQILEPSVSAASFEDARPDWLAAGRPGVTLVASPKYLAWKKFPPGTKAVYETRELRETGNGSNVFQRDPRSSRVTLQLESIDDKRAVVKTETIVWHMRGGDTRTADTVTYLSQQPASPTAPMPAMQTGAENLVINGKSFSTTWESFPSPYDPLTFTKTWYSDDVPGRMVREWKQNHLQTGGAGIRMVTETLYAPIEGVTPETSSPGQPVPAAQPSVGSSQAELTRRYDALTARATAASAGLDRFEQKLGTRPRPLPENVSTARRLLAGKLREAQGAIRATQNLEADDALRQAEGALNVIERFLGRSP